VNGNAASCSRQYHLSVLVTTDCERVMASSPFFLALIKMRYSAVKQLFRPFVQKKDKKLLLKPIAK